jgi:hypothetical protein
MTESGLLLAHTKREMRLTLKSQPEAHFSLEFQWFSAFRHLPVSCGSFLYLPLLSAILRLLLW